MTELRVLIIEDSQSDALLLLRELRQNGYEPIYDQVDNAEAMLNALATHTWDIVISDYAMPQFSGLAALEILQSCHIDIPFIIVSGAIGEETAVAAMKAGAHDYVMKGNLKRLAPAIERELREADERRARQQAESQLHRLSRALEQSASLVLIMDEQQIIRYVNTGLVQITGHSADEILGQPIESLRLAIEPEEELQHLVAAIASGREWRGEFFISREDGMTFWTRIMMSPIKNGEGDVTDFLFVGEDITERKHMEAELQRYTDTLELMVEERTTELHRAKDQIEVILNNSSDAIALAEASGNVQKTNPAYRQLFGDRAKHSIEQILTSLDEDDVEPVARSLLSVIYGNIERRVEAHMQTVDGRTIDADMAFAPVLEEGNLRAGVVLSLRDITHRKDLDRFKTQFVANATHDLSNPIAAMKIRLYLLQRRPEQSEEHLGVIERQLDRMETLVGELRTLSELDRGELKLDYAEFDLNTLVSEVVEAYQPLAKNRNLRLDFQPAHYLPYILADSQKCERIIVNLIANALNYTPEGGVINVGTRLAVNAITFSVSDTGIGIPEADVPHIFERFYRADQVKKEHSGTGLGLAIVKEIVELHGGQIDLESVVDTGTTFTVRLPLEPSNAG